MKKTLWVDSFQLHSWEVETRICVSLKADSWGVLPKYRAKLIRAIHCKRIHCERIHCERINCEMHGQFPIVSLSLFLSFLFTSFYLSPLAAGSHLKAILMHLMGTIYAQDRIKDQPVGVCHTPDVFRYKMVHYAAHVSSCWWWNKPKSQIVLFAKILR